MEIKIKDDDVIPEGSYELTNSDKLERAKNKLPEGASERALLITYDGLAGQLKRNGKILPAQTLWNLEKNNRILKKTDVVYDWITTFKLWISIFILFLVILFILIRPCNFISLDTSRALIEGAIALSFTTLITLIAWVPFISSVESINDDLKQIKRILWSSIARGLRFNFLSLILNFCLLIFLDMAFKVNLALALLLVGAYFSLASAYMLISVTQYCFDNLFLTKK